MRAVCAYHGEQEFTEPNENGDCFCSVCWGYMMTTGTACEKHGEQEFLLPDLRCSMGLSEDLSKLMAERDAPTVGLDVDCETEVSTVDYIDIDKSYELAAQHKSDLVFLDGRLVGLVQKAQAGDPGWIEMIVIKRLRRVWVDEQALLHEEWVTASPIGQAVPGHWSSFTNTDAGTMYSWDPEKNEPRAVRVEGKVEILVKDDDDMRLRDVAETLRKGFMPWAQGTEGLEDVKFDVDYKTGNITVSVTVPAKALRQEEHQ